MEKKQFYKSIVNKESKALETAERQEAKRQAKKRLADRSREKHKEPFDALIERHKAGLDRLGAVTKNGHSWGVVNNQKVTTDTEVGIPVILGPAPKSKATPNHTAVCVSAIRTPVGRDLQKPQFSRMSFDFAFIPNRDVDAFVTGSGYPLGRAQNSSQAIVCKEVSWSQDDLERVRDKVNYVSGVDGWSTWHLTLKNCQKVVEKFEKNLDWALEAAADTSLNPHLAATDQLAAQQSASSTLN